MEVNHPRPKNGTVMDISVEEIKQFIRKELTDGEAFFGLGDRPEPKNLTLAIAPGEAGQLQLLVKMLESFTPRPIHTDDELQVQLVICYLSNELDRFRSTPRYDKRVSKVHEVRDYRRIGSRHYLDILSEVFERCPTRKTTQNSDAFQFVKDEAYRQSLLADLGEVESALQGRNWKSATVLSGSLIEALLFYALRKFAESPATKAAYTKLDLEQVAPKVLGERGLSYLVRHAEAFGLISQQQKDVLKMMKWFRNLVHAGMSHREKRSCSRGTAYAVYGALLELEEHFHSNLV